MPKRSLLLIDLQNDFVEGGTLPVKGGREVVPAINELISKFDSVIATLDWHPVGHASFASSHEGCKIGDIVEVRGVEQALWPDHCVADTFGSQLMDTVNTEGITMYVQKGKRVEVDSYSGFYDNDKSGSTGLAEYLREIGTEEIFVAGIAMDYCVKLTVLDGLAEGFKVTIVTDATPSIDVNPGDGERVLAELIAAGAETTTVAEV